MHDEPITLTPGQRLKAILEYSGLTMRSFAKKCGYDREQGLYYVINGHTPNFSGELITRLHKAFPEIDIEWIVLGAGEMLKGNSSNAHQHTPVGYINVPLVPERARENVYKRLHDEKLMAKLPIIPTLADSSYKGNYVFFEVSGDGMDDYSSSSICDKDLVLGREIRKELWNKASLAKRKSPYVIVSEQEGILIRDVAEHDIENNTILCRSRNVFYEDISLDFDSVIGIYLITKIERRVR